MSKIEWEPEIVELPFCLQLQAMGWEWIEAEPDLPETSEGTRSREVQLKGRLRKAQREIKLRDGEPWLDDARLETTIRDLEQAPGHRPLEVNEAVTELLPNGALVDGLPDWDRG